MNKPQNGMRNYILRGLEIGGISMKDLKVIMTKGNGTKKGETDKQYTSMSNGRGVTEKMKQDWNRKPYYMLVGKDEK